MTRRFRFVLVGVFAIFTMGAISVFVLNKVNAASKDVSELTSEWKASMNFPVSGTKMQDGYFGEIRATFSLAPGAEEGDTITLTTPAGYTTSYESIDLIDTTGAKFGVMKRTSNTTYTITLNDYVTTHQQISGQMLFKEYVYGTDITWPLNTPKPLAFVVNNQIVDSRGIIIRVTGVTHNQNAFIQSDKFGQGFYRLMGIHTETWNGAQEIYPIGVPARVMQTAPGGTVWNCDLYKSSLYVSLSENPASPIPSDIKPFGGIRAEDVSCTPSTLAYTIPKYTGTEGAAEFYLATTWVLITDQAKQAGQTSFTGGDVTIVGKDPVTGAPKTYSWTAKGIYKYPAGEIVAKPGGATAQVWGNDVRVGSSYKDTQSSSRNSKIQGGLREK